MMRMRKVRSRMGREEAAECIWDWNFTTIFPFWRKTVKLLQKFLLHPMPDGHAIAIPLSSPPSPFNSTSDFYCLMREFFSP
jgi:hypothetical protein